MRNTGVIDVYGLSIPVEITSVAGTTTHRYTNGDGFTVFVKDTGAEKVTVSIHAPEDYAVIEEKRDVTKEDVEEVTKALLGRWRF